MVGFQRIATVAVEHRMAGNLEPEHEPPAFPTIGVARSRQLLSAMGWGAMRGTHLKVNKRVIRAECCHHRPPNGDGPCRDGDADLGDTPATASDANQFTR